MGILEGVGAAAIAAVSTVAWRLRREGIRRDGEIRNLTDRVSESETRAERSERDANRLQTLLVQCMGPDMMGSAAEAGRRWMEQWVALAAEFMGCAEVLFAVVERPDNRLMPWASRGIVPAKLSNWREWLGEGPVGQAAARSSPALWTAPDSETPQVPFSFPALLLPLVLEGAPAGLIVLAAPAAGSFDPPSRSRADLLAHLARVGLSSFQAARQIESSYDEMVRTLSHAISIRDAYTHFHSDRTRALVQPLGQECRLPSALIRQIEHGAYLHDLGKIGIDDAILRKPGKLTPEEYTQMKKHPGFGYDILQPVPYLRGAAAIVLYHQEWFNGQGYPEGLAGEEIPLGARLVSVIDAWDAMTSNRPYRQAMPKAAAVAELRRQAGTQFDPKAVDAFLKVLERLEREGVATTEAGLATAASAGVHA